MAFSLLLLALTAGILLRQVQQGLFSAFIMTVLTMCCAATAIGSYEWVTNHWVIGMYPTEWNRGYCLPVVLAALFGIPLIILRLIFDRFIRRACLLPGLIDRIGAGACGFITAMVTTGIVALGIQMLPFQNGSVIGYSRVGVVNESSSTGATPKWPDHNTVEKEILHRPDRFATFMTTLVIEGIFGSKQSFAEHNPDFVQAIGWNNSTHREVSRYAPPDSIQFISSEPVDFVYKYAPGDTRAGRAATYDPEPAKVGELRLIRVKLRNQARDERRSHIFTLRQFRLVGKPPGEGEALRQYFPIAIQQEDPNQPVNRHVRYKQRSGGSMPVLDEFVKPRDGNSDEVEIVFDIPRSFKPAFLEYKREARTSISFDASRAAASPRPAQPQPAAPTAVATGPSPTQPPPTTPTVPPDSGSGTSGRRPRASDTGSGGAVRGVAATAAESLFSDQLPMTMRAYQGLQNPEISGETITRGHLVGQVDQQATGTDPAVSRFMVPAGKRLLQLRAQRLQASSIFGQALNQAVTTVQNYFVEDTNGNRYTIVGKYAIAAVRTRPYVEVQYFADQAGSAGGLGDFRRIRERSLTDQDQFTLLFLVDPGAHIVAFSTGGSATRRDDLTADNLIAPP